MAGTWPSSGLTLRGARLEEPPRRLAGRAVIQVNHPGEVKPILGDAGWPLIQPSGTEPAVRLFAEASAERDLGVIVAEGEEPTL